MLRYAGIATALAMAAGVVAWVSPSNLVEFFALLAMHLGLVLAVAFLILSVGGSSRGSSDPPPR
jgi:high-affinity Fe2+/Pb2+ permease